jgi:hypothetical protein
MRITALLLASVPIVFAAGSAHHATKPDVERETPSLFGCGYAAL